MNIITLVPLSRQTHRETLTYFSSLPLVPGDLVGVPFGNNSNLIGIVSGVEPLSVAKGNIKELAYSLKKVTSKVSTLPTPITKAIKDTFIYIKDKKVSINHFIPKRLFQALLQIKDIDDFSLELHVYPTAMHVPLNAEVVLHGKLKEDVFVDNLEKSLSSTDIVCTTPLYAWLFCHVSEKVFIHDSQHKGYIDPLHDDVSYIEMLEHLFSKIELNDEYLEKIHTPERLVLVEQNEDERKVLSTISQGLVSEIQNAKNVVILAPRKDYATMTVCNDCQEVYTCPICEKPMRLSKKFVLKDEQQSFRCFSCKETYTALTRCRDCKSHKLVSFGYTLEKIKTELENAEVYDKKRIKIFTPKDLQKNLNKVKNKDEAVLVFPSLETLLLPYSPTPVIDFIRTFSRVSEKIGTVAIQHRGKFPEIVEKLEKNDSEELKVMLEEERGLVFQGNIKSHIAC